MIPKHLRSRMEVACPPTVSVYKPRHRAAVEPDSSTAPFHFRIENNTGATVATAVGWHPAAALAERRDMSRPKEGPHLILVGTHRAKVIG